MHQMRIRRPTELIFYIYPIEHIFDGFSSPPFVCVFVCVVHVSRYMHQICIQAHASAYVSRYMHRIRRPIEHILDRIQCIDFFSKNTIGLFAQGTGLFSKYCRSLCTRDRALFKNDLWRRDRALFRRDRAFL